MWPTGLLPENVQSDKALKRRVDYTIGLQLADHDLVMEILESAEDHTITQSNHPMLRDRALCSHLEIKTEGNTREARLQLSTWCAAGFQKQENLWLQRHRYSRSVPMPVLAPMPLWLWHGKDVQLWVAVMDSAKTKILVLDERQFSVDEEDPESLRRVILTIASVMNWGYIYFLPWFRDFLGRADLNDNGFEKSHVEVQC